MNNQVSTVTAKRAATPKRGKLRSINVDVAGNGYTCIAQYEPAGGKEGMNDPWSPALQDRTVHESVESLCECIEGLLGAGDAGSEKDEKDDKGESGN